MVNILLDRLPKSVNVGGIEYPVNWGYRAMVLIEICMFDSQRNEEQRTLDALNIFYQQNIPLDFSAALEQLLWFYRCGKTEEKAENNKNGAPVRQNKRSYCFNQDAPYIYAAFWTQYGIDLNNTKNYDLHWWKFHAMFESFGEELKISKIMYYRIASLTGLSKEKRKFLNEMKKHYALNEPGETVDGRLKLLRRNTAMKAYVRKRASEAYVNDESKVP